MSFIVAIDGPAGSGKGTITKLIGDKLNLVTFDTGAMYRAISYYMIKNKIGLDDNEKVAKMLEEIDINLDFQTGKQVLYLNSEKLVNELRTKEVNEIVSQVSHIPEVRAAMVKLQRKLAEGKNVIMEGRDIGTNVFPNADVKIYLDASAEERANRRLKQNQENNITNISYEEILENIKFRDNNDKNSDVAPLKKADDAIVVDSTNLSIKQVVNQIIDIIKKKQKEQKLNKKVYEETPDTKFKRFRLNLVRKIVYFAFYKLVYRIKKVNEENLPKDGAYIICANHINMLDALAVVCSCKRKVRFICKASMFKSKALGWALKLSDTIPLDRDKNDIESMKRSIKTLKNGEVLGVFPEGTRKGMEKNLKAKSGAAFFSLRTGTPVVPIGIQGSFKPFTKVKLVFGKPLDFSEYYGKEKDKEALEKVTNVIMDNIIMLTNKDK